MLGKGQQQITLGYIFFPNLGYTPRVPLSIAPVHKGLRRALVFLVGNVLCDAFMYTTQECLAHTNPDLAGI